MKILNIDDMLEAARESGMPDYEGHRTLIEQAATMLARALSEHLGIGCNHASFDGKEFGGLCVGFSPCHDDHPCPTVIHNADPSGDWGESSAPVMRKTTAPKLAREFSRLLRCYLTSKQMCKVINRNRKEECKGVCHSHDFCDANEVMDEAFKNMTGISTGDTSPASVHAPCMSDQARQLWIRAWKIAKKNEFKL